tara:strand:- start:2888 stop:4057 length:1170 start_codon:yes stop_codon:yes gene_type:complete
MKITKDQIRKLVLEKIDAKRTPLKLSDVNPEIAKKIATSGLKDGDPKDDVIGVKNKPEGITSVQKLKPSQSSMNIKKAMAFVINMLSPKNKDLQPGGNLNALISKDGFIMDGHHRWVASAMIDPNLKVGGLLVDYPGKELVAILNTMSKGLFGVDQGNPATGGFDQFVPEKIKSQLMAYVKAGVWSLSPDDVMDVLKKFTGKEGQEAVDAAVAKMVTNLGKVSFKLPNWAPERPDMPIIDADKGQVAASSKALAGGTVDWNAPEEAAANRKEGLEITESLIRKVVTESLRRTGRIQESFRMEKDFKKGMPVTWNTLEKVVKKTASGREKVDYERVSNKGYIMDDTTYRAKPGSAEPGLVIIKDLDGNSHTIAITELTPAKDDTITVTVK